MCTADWHMRALVSMCPCAPHTHTHTDTHTQTHTYIHTRAHNKRPDAQFAARSGHNQKSMRTMTFGTRSTHNRWYPLRYVYIIINKLIESGPLRGDYIYSNSTPNCLGSHTSNTIKTYFDYPGCTCPLAQATNVEKINRSSRTWFLVG